MLFSAQHDSPGPNYKAIKDQVLVYREKNESLSQEKLENIKLIKDPSYTKAKGRPKNHQRLLGLYNKLKQLELKKVIFV